MASNAEIENTFSKFQAANKRLIEVISSEMDEKEIKRDAVIKRFEFTYEILWKTFKRIAQREKIETFSPKSAIQAAFRFGLIKNERLYLDIIDARNKTTHIYSEEDVIQIYNFILRKVVDEFKQVEERLKKYIQKI